MTAATDGRVNFWSLANLRDPVETIQIGDSVSCLAVSPESGMLYFMSQTMNQIQKAAQKK